MSSLQLQAGAIRRAGVLTFVSTMRGKYIRWSRGRALLRRCVCVAARANQFLACAVGRIPIYFWADLKSPLCATGLT